MICRRLFISLVTALVCLSGRCHASLRTAEQLLVDSVFEQADSCYAEADYPQSLKLLLQILPMVDGDAFDGEDRASCYNLASLVNLRLGNFDQAIAYAEQTLAIDQAAGNAEDISSSLNVLSGIYQAAEQPEQALRYILEAIGVERPLRRNDRLSIRLGLASEIYVKLEQGEEALRAAQEALQLVLPDGNPSTIGIRLSQLAAACQVLGQGDKAEALLDEAIDSLRVARNLNSLAISLNQLGNVASARGNRAKAAACFAESATLSRETGNTMVEAKACYQAAQLLRSTDPAAALELLERYVTLNLQLYSEQSAQALANFEIRYETAKKQHQVEMLEGAQKVHYMWIAALCLLLAAAVVGIVQLRRIARLRTQQEHMLVRSNILGITELGDLPDIRFTKRELEVIAYCAQGLMAKEVADRMGISERTVNVHKNNIFRKLGIQNTVELVIYAKKAGIVPDEKPAE